MFSSAPNSPRRRWRRCPAPRSASAGSPAPACSAQDPNVVARGASAPVETTRAMAARVLLTGAAALLLAGPAWGQGSARIAALQTALSEKGMYGGTIDGVNGPGTRAAV